MLERGEPNQELEPLGLLVETNSNCDGKINHLVQINKDMVKEFVSMVANLAYQIGTFRCKGELNRIREGNSLQSQDGREMV